MKNFKTYAWMMATAIACVTVAACSYDEGQSDKPFTICPVEQTKLFACEVNIEPQETTAAADTIFTEDDIEWFNETTREIRLKDKNGQLFKKLMENYHKSKWEFRLGENVLFDVQFVSDFDSRVFFDLVLHYSSIGEDEGNPRYYLQDCYPPQMIDHELTQANIKKNAAQWEAFIHYLESIGKLRK